MKTWLERLRPAGEPIELPEGVALLVLGRSARATIVFDDRLVAARHLELKSDGAFWRIRDLDTEAGTRVNGAPVTWPRALFRGDVIAFGTTQLRFSSEPPPAHPALVAAIDADPDAPTPWLVYADWLAERGDPLGARIARGLAGERLDHHDWVGPLAEDFTAGAIELEWGNGVIKRATLRRVPGREPIDWRAAVSTLFQLRVGGLVQHLTVDLPRLSGRGQALLPSDIAEAQAYLAGLPTFPPLLRSLSLGLLLGPRSTEISAALPLVDRAPGLARAAVFAWARGARLRLLETAGPGFDGLADGRRPLSAVTRLRRGTSGVVHLETPPAARAVEGNPCFLRPAEGGWELSSARLKGDVRVNGLVAATSWLLPGDVIEVRGAGRLAYEVDA